MSGRLIGVTDWLRGQNVSLRLVTPADCTARYEGWLANPRVNRYLETRWRSQSLASIVEFVQSMLDSPDSYLFAIVENSTGEHVGNIKIGPINGHHSFADVSYFIGETDRHGRGYATEAIRLVRDFAFVTLGLHRIQAGLYAGNAASARALEKAGFSFEATFVAQLKNADGEWEDHRWYALLRDRWEELRRARETSGSD